jgi:hypothetical protein
MIAKNKPGTTSTRYDAIKKAIAKFLKTENVNYGFLGLNIVLLSFGIITLIVCLNAHRTIKNDFLQMQIASEANPCAVATPSAQIILDGIGKKESSSTIATRKIETSICESSNVYIAISSVFDNNSMTHLPDDDSFPHTYTNAENDLVENLCNQRDPKRLIYGEIRKRIATAYILANPAFRIYTTGCMQTNDPFTYPEAACTHASTVVFPELYQASFDMSIAGWGQIPSTGIMLYRLMALSVIAYHDRTHNNNACFENKGLQNATQLCLNIYSFNQSVEILNIINTLQSLSPSSTSQSVHAYETAIHNIESCNSIFAKPYTASPPSPPPYPKWDFSSPQPGQDTQSLNPFVEVCRNVHTFGHFDQQSAFGIPDIIHPFSWKPDFGEWPASWFYDSLVKDKMSKAPDYETNPVNALKLHNAYRFAVSSAMMIITASCCAYWIGFATIPLLAFVLYRYLGLENQTPDKTKVLFAPRLGATTYAAIFTNIAVCVYTLYLDPWLPVARSYTSNPSCMNWQKTSSSSVFVTSDHIKGFWTDMIQWIFLISVVYVLAHHSTISKKKKSKKEKESIPWVKRIPKWTPALIITQLGSIIYFVIISTTDGEAWFDTTIRRHPNAHYKSLPQAQQLTNDVDTAIVAAILGGTVC